MTSDLETVHTYWDASARGDYQTAGGSVALPDYVSIDHQRGVAGPIEQLRQARAEDDAWSQREFEITNVLETTDGALGTSGARGAERT